MESDSLFIVADESVECWCFMRVRQCSHNGTVIFENASISPTVLYGRKAWATGHQMRTTVPFFREVKQNRVSATLGVFLRWMMGGT